MAPTKGSARQGPRLTLNKVQSGRVGQSISNRKHVNKNDGKEIISKANNAGKELFPAKNNANKELFPGLLSISTSVTPASQSTAVTEPHTPSQNEREAQDRAQRPAPPKAVVKRHVKQNKGKAFFALQAANLEQRQGKLVRDGITKRLEALQVDLNHIVNDARESKTISYASARLDLDPGATTDRPKKLKFSITVGLWGYTPVFTPTKIFSLSRDRFADVDGLGKLIYGNSDVQKAIAGIGLDIDTTTPVGYEMSFPKGYRYIQGESYDHKRNCPLPFQVAHSEGHALVNTPCALKEFFWQAGRYACDDNGNVLIPVTMRIGMTQTQQSGERLTGKLNVKWRNDSEKRWEAEDKRRGLERQSFATGAERLLLNERMKAIEERSKRAMEDAKAQKDLAAAAVREQIPTVIGGSDLGVLTQSAGLNVNDEGVYGTSDDMELDLDLDLF